MSTYRTATIEGLRRPDGWSPIRSELGVASFGVNAWTAADTGAAVIPEHDEVPSGHEELYLVTAGRATFTVDGDEVDASQGTIVHVSDPAAKRGAVAAEPGTTVLAIGARPGEAYRPRSWETNVDVFPMWEAGDFEGVKRVTLDALEQYEDRGTLFYNLACAEAQLGEHDAALEHLAAAIEERPDLAENAKTDSDLDPIRSDPRFP